MSRSDAESVFRLLNPEVWIVTSQSGEQRGGLVVTNLMPASIVQDLPRVIMGISRQHASWQLIHASRQFVGHLIPSERVDLVELFGLHSSREREKFASLDVPLEEGRLPVLPDAVGWIRCQVEAEWDSGDRSFFLAEVVDAQLPGQNRDVLRLQELLAKVSAGMLEEMRRQRIADAEADARAIARWQKRGTS